MKQLLILIAIVVGLFCTGCGGGGGSTPTVTITGTIEDVVNGIPATQAQIQVGSSTTTTLSSAADGSFTITAPSGANTLRVDRRDGSSLFVFTFAPITTSTDVGQLWIGPSKITATGRALDSTTLAPIAGATVTLGGVQGTTAHDGTFSVAGVAYSATGLFPNMPGQITATGYIAANFTPSSRIILSSILSLGDIGLVPSSSSNPPGSPYNIWGRVSPLSASPGATVTLSISGTPYRSTTVGSDGTYYFWVPAGTYTITVTKTGYTATPITGTLTSTSEVVEEDVTLTPTP